MIKNALFTVWKLTPIDQRSRYFQRTLLPYRSPVALPFLQVAEEALIPPPLLRVETLVDEVSSSVIIFNFYLLPHTISQFLSHWNCDFTI